MKEWLIKLLGGYTQNEINVVVGKSTMTLFSGISKRLEQFEKIDSFHRDYILFGDGQPCLTESTDIFALDLPTSFKEKSA